MPQENTVVVFKPECDGKKIAMARDAFKTKGLKIARSRFVTITVEVIEAIFVRHRNGPIHDAVVSDLSGNRLLVYEFVGENAIQQVREIVGLRAILKRCDPKSLRYKFYCMDGRPAPIPIGRDQSFDRNYIYRPRDQFEAELALRTLFNNSLQWCPT